MDIPRFKAGDDTGAIQEGLWQAGVVVVEDVLSKEQVNAIRQESRPLLEEAGSSLTGINEVVAAFFGDRTKHVAGLAGKSRAFVENLMCSPVMLSLCDEVLLKNSAGYQLNLAHMMVRGPGSKAQMMHRDEDVWVHLTRVQHDEVELSTMTALVDFTEENGATLVVPGSHRWDRARQPEADEIKVAEAPAGSSIIYLGSLLHAGGANRTEGFWREGIHMSYNVGWLRTQENNYLSVPPDIAVSLPEKARELLGYGVHDAIEDLGGFLGMLELQDPRKILFGEKL